MTEKQKYVDGVTKIGGYPVSEDVGVQSQKDVEISGQEFLSMCPPWRCALCNVNCTSESTMLAHAAGQKHRRRARAVATVSADVTGNVKVGSICLCE